MLPLGQEGLGYKGYALSMVLSVLSGALIGSYDFDIHRPTYGGVFLGAIDIAAFTPIDEFKRSMDDMVADIKSSKLAKGFKEILIPGEGARAREEQALKSGVPLDDWAWEKLMETAKELGVDTSAYEVEDGGARVSLKR
jgi:LDH2 family malate/lactate/ureidoglycolate dehydrogenase